MSYNFQPLIHVNEQNLWIQTRYRMRMETKYSIRNGETFCLCLIQRNPSVSILLKTNVNSTQNLATLLINLSELEIYYFTVYCFNVYFTDVTSLIWFVVIVDVENSKARRSANKFSKSQIRKFVDLNNFIDLRTFRNESQAGDAYRNTQPAEVRQKM
jgi:hypothetical protein